MGALFVLNCHWSWHESVTVPINGVEVNEFGLGSFLWFGLGKNFLKKTELFERNLRALSYCTKEDGR